MDGRYDLLQKDRIKYDRHRDIAGFLSRITILEFKVKNLEMMAKEVLSKLNTKNYSHQYIFKKF